MKHRIARECYISETNANLIGTAYSCLQEMGTMGRVVPSILALRGAMPLESSKARSHSSKIPIRGTVSIKARPHGDAFDRSWEAVPSDIAEVANALRPHGLH